MIMCPVIACSMTVNCSGSYGRYLLVRMGLLALCCCPVVAMASEHFEQVDGWTGSYRASVHASNSGQILMVDKLQEHQSISAQVTLDKRKISRKRIIWKGTASCKSSASFNGAGSIPGSPFHSEEFGRDSRMFTTPAELIIDPDGGEYTLSVCRQAFSYVTFKTGTAMNAKGEIVKVSEKGSHRVNPGNFFDSDLMPEGPLPRQGFELMGSYDIANPAGNGLANGINLQALTGIKLGGQVQWNFSPDLCSEADENYGIRIVLPLEPIELSFKNQELTGYFDAEPVPDEEGLRFRILWQAFKIDESTLEAKPENLNAPSVNLTFKGIPGRNDAFGEKNISATLGSLEHCTKPDEKKVTVFYEQDGTDNGSDDPNWMWYWLQTSAGKQYADFIRHGGGEDCTAALGYFVGGALDGSESEEFYLCDSILSSRPADPFGLLSGVKLHSIDVFAIIAIHENQHRLDYRHWWRNIPAKARPGEANWESVDADLDLVPDLVEAELAGYSPFSRDSFNIGFRDGEVSAYKTAGQWPVGSADKEDWGCPGAQGEDVCKEEKR